MNLPRNEIQIWHGCYDASWKAVITDESFTHPAKMAQGLLAHIIKHGFDKGYWQRGSLIADPFGGIGSTGILASYCGLRSVSMELELEFYRLAAGYDCPGMTKGDWLRWFNRFPHHPGICPECHAKAQKWYERHSGIVPWRLAHHYIGNFELHRGAWLTLNEPQAVMVQGDSRRFAEIVGQVAGVVTSPPFVDSLLTKDKKFMAKVEHDKRNGSRLQPGIGDYGSTPGQIGRLPAGQVDAVVTSPPYAETLQREGETSSGAGGPIHARFYGPSAGQIGRLPAGSVDGCVTSPPYAESIKGDHFERETAKESRAKRNTPGGPLGQSQRHGGYGASEGNIGNLKEGSVDGVVTSPPFADSDQRGADRPYDFQRESGKAFGRGASMTGCPDSPGQIGRLPAGQVDAVVTSPPFAQAQTGGGIAVSGMVKQKDGQIHPLGNDGYQKKRHGDMPGQIANLKEGRVEGVITSPPFQDQTPTAGDPKYAWKFHGDQSQYGESAGQIGNTNGETYWQAMRAVYEQVRLALKPGGVMAVVVKDYVKTGKRVPLCDDTLKLLEALGFEPLERVRAMLVKETTENTLFEGLVTKKKERKSFFRRLGELKAAARKFWESLDEKVKGDWLAQAREQNPKAVERRLLEKAQLAAYDDAGRPLQDSPRIDWEEVLFVRKTGDNDGDIEGNPGGGAGPGDLSNEGLAGLEPTPTEQDRQTERGKERTP